MGVTKFMKITTSKVFPWPGRPSEIYMVSTFFLYSVFHCSPCSSYTSFRSLPVYPARSSFRAFALCFLILTLPFLLEDGIGIQREKFRSWYLESRENCKRSLLRHESVEEHLKWNGCGSHWGWNPVNTKTWSPMVVLIYTPVLKSVDQRC